MSNQGALGERPGWQRGARPAETGRATLRVLPCTVSQLLSARSVRNEVFALCDQELHQVSVVGVVRELLRCATYDQYFVDDMTGPPLTVRQWIGTEDSSCWAGPEPGSYVKVHGNLRMFQGRKSLLALRIRRVKDPNEITSHMLEVVHAQMQLFGKSCDVNMNALPMSDGPRASNEEYVVKGLSTPQRQVLRVICRHSETEVGLSFVDLVSQLDDTGVKDIRKSLAFLINEGHVFYTVDEDHFKSSEH